MKKVLIVTISAMLLGLVTRAADTADTNTDVTTTPSTMPTGSDSSHSSHTGKFGAGITFGEPIGADVKYWLNETMAIDGALGWSFHDDTDVYLHSDFLWHNFQLIPVSQGQMPLYFGVGALARFRHGDDANQAGIRAPVGISYMFDNVPVDIFAEVAPAIDVAPFVRGEVTGGIGIRYWF
jgi:hypothetical protein